MKKNGLAKVFAIFALIGIVVSVVGTGILVLMSSNEVQEQTFTQEQLNEMIRISTGEVSTGALDSNELISTGEVSTGELDEEVLSSTGEIK